jgi:hypothetical protein
VAEWNPATSTYTVLTNTLDIRFDIWRRRVGNRTHDGSPEYSGCIQFLVWLPHYSRPAILHTTARTAVREFMGVQIGELYGIKSQQNRVGNRFVFYTPVVTALDGLNYIVDPMLKSVPPEMSEAFNLGDPMLGGLTESVTVV